MKKRKWGTLLAAPLAVALCLLAVACKVGGVSGTAGSTAAETAEQAQDKLQQAESAAENGNTAEAVTLLQEILKEEPDHREACALLASVGLSGGAGGLEETQQIWLYENLNEMGQLPHDKLGQLGMLYAETGMNRKARDVLEQAYRLSQQEEFLERLEQLSVDIAEEDENTGEKAAYLYGCLDQGGYQEAVEELLSPGWFSVMMPKLTAGHRKYVLTGEGAVLKIEVGYGARDTHETAVWFQKGDRILFMTADEDELLYMDVPADGTGSYGLRYCESLEGSVYADEGSVQNGLLHGEYRARIGSGDTSLGLTELWKQTQEPSGTLYLGNFEQGLTGLEQKKTDRIVYAAQEDGELYLYRSDETDAGQAVFDLSYFGWREFPDW